MIVCYPDAKDGLPSLDQTRGDNIFTGHVPDFSGADQLSVEVGLVIVVHRSETQRQFLAGPCGRDFHLLAEPEYTVG